MGQPITREFAIANPTERTYTVVECPPMNPAVNNEPTTLRIRSMYPGEIIELENGRFKDGEATWRFGHMFELMAAFSIVDDDGKRIFSDEDIRTTWWRKMHRDFFRAMIREVREINDNEEIAKEQDAEVKNSLDAKTIDSPEG